MECNLTNFWYVWICSKIHFWNGKDRPSFAGMRLKHWKHWLWWWYFFASYLNYKRMRTFNWNCQVNVQTDTWNSWEIQRSIRKFAINIKLLYQIWKRVAMWRQWMSTNSSWDGHEINVLQHQEWTYSNIKCWRIIPFLIHPNWSLKHNCIWHIPFLNAW